MVWWSFQPRSSASDTAVYSPSFKSLTSKVVVAAGLASSAKTTLDKLVPKDKTAAKSMVDFNNDFFIPNTPLLYMFTSYSLTQFQVLVHDKPLSKVSSHNLIE